MIRTATQLKALVRNLAKSTGVPNYVLLRRYMMERFLERLSQTKYRDAFILKGGMLISEMVGIGARETKDIDTTVSGLSLTEKNMEQVFREITAVDLGDQVTFELVGISPIMDESEYEGLRVGIDSRLDNMVMPLKVDLSTGDSITPKAVVYDYSLMFEGRTISVKAYPIETVLAEKIETMLSRAETNTRMRDFYDMHILLKCRFGEIDDDTLQSALEATAKQRGTAAGLNRSESVLKAIENSSRMAERWQNYQMKNTYAKDISWDAVTISARTLCRMSGLDVHKPSVKKILTVVNEESRNGKKAESDKERSRVYETEER